MIVIPPAIAEQFEQIRRALPPTVHEITWTDKGQVVEVQFGPGHDCGRLTLARCLTAEIQLVPAGPGIAGFYEDGRWKRRPKLLERQSGVSGLVDS